MFDPMTTVYGIVIGLLVFYIYKMKKGKAQWLPLRV